MMPDTKVSVGAFAGALLATGLWLARVIRGEPVPITPEETLMASTVIIFVIQYCTRNRRSK